MLAKSNDKCQCWQAAWLQQPVHLPSVRAANPGGHLVKCVTS